jgi:hypothetical protein
MSLDIYKKKIEEYVSKKSNTSDKADMAKGLLAPKGMIEKETGKQRDAIENVGEFVFALRQKRMETKKQRGKQ